MPDQKENFEIRALGKAQNCEQEVKLNSCDLANDENLSEGMVQMNGLDINSRV